MKNALNYYYGIKVEDIHQINGIYKFTIYGQEYALVPYNRDIKDIDELYKISISFLNRGIYCHQIIQNKDHLLITYINQSPYVLLQIYIDENKIIDEEDIKSFSNITLGSSFDSTLRRDDWKKLWTNKIDYFEYQVSQFGKKYPLIRESFSYYVGFVETGISLLNTISIDHSELVISHRRLRKQDTLFELYNPINFIIDVKVRDICEYFKECFINGLNIIDKIKNYIYNSNMNNYDCIMFFIRMLYPSFYFDIYEDIIENDVDEKKLLKVIKLNKNYEKLIKETYIFLSRYINIPDIEWIKKM